MRLKHLLILLIASLCNLHVSFSQTVIKATSFGVRANSHNDAAAGIRKAIEACKKKKNAVLLLPGGRIDIYPAKAAERELYISNCTENDTLSKRKKIAFAFEDCSNITLDGNNTLVVLHGKMISFALLNSFNIKIRNIQFDYERPTMSELTIRTVNDSIIETEIHPDSKYTIDSGHISFYGEGWKNKSYHTISYDPGKQRMYYSSLQPLLNSKAVRGSNLQVRFEGRFAKAGYKAGDVLSFRDPYRDNCGGFISLSRNIILENVQMHYMHGLGIVSQFSEDISLFKVVVAPRAGSGRMIASFADCFHFSGCKGLVKIDSCFTSGSHDDPVNVHGTHLQVTAIDSPKKLTVRFMHHQTYGFAAFFAGDSIAFINPKTLLSLGSAKLKHAKLLNSREMELELDGDLPAYVQNGLCIENLTWTPEVQISNSRFERTNTRGLLITTRRKVLIENNYFYHTGMFPILIADDAASWFESGPVTDMLIRNNVFDGCGYNSGSGAINIAPENHEWEDGRYVHRNIRIINNRFIDPVNDVLKARSVEGLEFAGNEVEQGRQASTSSKIMVNITGCTGVRIMKNNFQGADTPTVHIDRMTGKDLKTDCKIDAN